MKKDPLTQTSINSFFSAGVVKKREPDENMANDRHQSENSQNAKRRKIDDSVENGHVKIKTEPIDEPMDTFNGEQPQTKREPNDNYSNSIPVKQEVNSDVETDTEAVTDDEMPNVPIKQEVNSDIGTDTEDESDDDNHGGACGGTVAAVKIKTEPGVEPQVNRTIKQEPETVNQTQAQSNEPITIKNEPQDEVIESDQETDDEEIPNKSLFNQHIDQQIGGRIGFFDTIGRQNETQDPALNFDWRNQPSTSSQLVQPPSYTDRHTLYSSDQQFNVVGSKSSTPATTADGTPLLRFNNFHGSDENVPDFYKYQQPSGSNEQQSSAYLASANENEEEPNNFPVTPRNNEHFIAINDDDDDDDFDFEDLGDELDKFMKREEEQLNEEIKVVKKMSEKIDGMTDEHLLQALREKVAALHKRKQSLVSRKVQEEKRKSEAEKTKIQNHFMYDLFGPAFDIKAFEDRLLNGTPSYGASTSRSRDDKKDIKKDVKMNVSYGEIIDKIKPEPDDKKAIHRHQITVKLDEHIKQKHRENKLNEVPQNQIDLVKKQKTKIRDKVNQYLAPYYENGTIRKNEYEEFSSSITKECFSANIYGK